ncbi:MAG: hypothetical protein HFE49_02970 [Clostridia bacterium]|nr:hypothetical protein [Clostridia bacterium]
MKILKNTMIVSSYVLLVALFFGGGYALGRIGIRNDVLPETTMVPDTVQAVSETVTESPVYELIIEDGELRIYKCIGENKTIIASEKISENVFPRLDVEELRKGVKFERLEAAQQMFENFVS